MRPDPDAARYGLVETDAQGFLRIPVTDTKSLGLEELKESLSDAALAALTNGGDVRWRDLFALDLRGAAQIATPPPE